ncbi:hypothetical protein ABPG72_020776 [Tetrahymena utriculariae]
MESSSHLGQHMAVEELHNSPDFDLAEQLDRSAVLQQNSQPNQSKIKQHNYNTMNAESQSSSSPNKRSHTEEVISIEEFSKIAPNVKALYQLCILQGYYAPKNAAMKWLLSKYIEQKRNFHIEFTTLIFYYSKQKNGGDSDKNEVIQKFCKITQQFLYQNK